MSKDCAAMNGEHNQPVEIYHCVLCYVVASHHHRNARQNPYSIVLRHTAATQLYSLSPSSQGKTFHNYYHLSVFLPFSLQPFISDKCSLEKTIFGFTNGCEESFARTSCNVTCLTRDNKQPTNQPTNHCIPAIVMKLFNFSSSVSFSFSS